MGFYTWKAPLRNQFKINVHVIHTSRPLNGNTNGVGIIIRDHRGRLVKALTGTMRGLSTLATQLWAIHLGLNQARLSNCEHILIKTDNFNPYFEVSRQDGRGDRTCLWIVEQVKKLLGYNPEWDNIIQYIPESSNRCVYYLAAVGLNNWTAMHLVHEPFGRLQEKMDLDMGFGPPIPQLQVYPIPVDSQGRVLGFAPVVASTTALVVHDQTSVMDGGEN